MTDVQRPDWLKPGAEVVTWTNDYGRRVMYVKRTKVAKVAQKSFTVEGASDRFDMHTMMAKGGGPWPPRRPGRQRAGKVCAGGVAPAGVNLLCSRRSGAVEQETHPRNPLGRYRRSPSRRGGRGAAAVTSSSAATPPASGTPMGDERVADHLDHPVDGCSRPCCRITFTDHLGAVKVWSWMRSQWEAEQDPECE